jgi:hypothetical protein
VDLDSRIEQNAAALQAHMARLEEENARLRAIAGPHDVHDADVVDGKTALACRLTS